MSFRKLDIENWKRKDIYHFFKTYDNPYYNICSKLEVENLYQFCKKENLSFNLALLHSTLLVINDLQEFKLRIEGDEVIEYATINCGSTVLSEDETFSFCYFNFCESMSEFIENSRKVIDLHLQKKQFDPRDNVQNLIYFSVLPWINFTSITHAKRFNSGESIPLITFGKLHQTNQVRQIPISVEVNHALVDGIHVGKFLNKLQSFINQF
jgi:chloramphenicol O-acetyltransferase type A